LSSNFYFSFLSSQVLPIITPFSFGEEDFNFDDSTSVTKGDSPIKIWWTFKSEDEEIPYNLTSNDGVIITRTTQKISMIAIEAVKARHRGNYTCYASNKAGVTSHSSYLSINGYKNILNSTRKFCNLSSHIFIKNIFLK
jgi:hypothetical protein